MRFESSSKCSLSSDFFPPAPVKQLHCLVASYASFPLVLWQEAFRFAGKCHSLPYCGDQPTALSLGRLLKYSLMILFIHTHTHEFKGLFKDKKENGNNGNQWTASKWVIFALYSSLFFSKTIHVEILTVSKRKFFRVSISKNSKLFFW